VTPQENVSLSFGEKPNRMKICRVEGCQETTALKLNLNGLQDLFQERTWRGLSGSNNKVRRLCKFVRFDCGGGGAFLAKHLIPFSKRNHHPTRLGAGYRESKFRTEAVTILTRDLMAAHLCRWRFAGVDTTSLVGLEQRGRVKKKRCGADHKDWVCQ
jgi:hypothetical protein